MIDFNLLLKSQTSKFFAFRGRASRKEYIYAFALIHLLIILAHYLTTFFDHSLINILGGFCGFLGLYSIIPFVSINVRRLHDINKSGWWLFFAGFIPLVGIFIISIFLLFLKGTPGPNKYGEPPS